MLKCEKNTLTMGKRVERAARKLLGRKRRMNADFEHGQWFVTDLDTGSQWSANDGEGPDTADGFCFEQVSQGDED